MDRGQFRDWPDSRNSYQYDTMFVWIKPKIEIERDLHWKKRKESFVYLRLFSIKIQFEETFWINIWQCASIYSEQYNKEKTKIKCSLAFNIIG